MSTAHPAYERFHIEARALVAPAACEFNASDLGERVQGIEADLQPHHLTHMEAHQIK